MGAIFTCIVTLFVWALPFLMIAALCCDIFVDGGFIGVVSFRFFATMASLEIMVLTSGTYSQITRAVKDGPAFIIYALWCIFGVGVLFWLHLPYATIYFIAIYIWVAFLPVWVLKRVLHWLW